MVAALSGDVFVGLVLGLFIGILVGPLMRAWLSWQEWKSASRDADLAAAREPDLHDHGFDLVDFEAWAALPGKDVGDNPLSSGRRDAR
jgi:hypothetical protein